jgi:glutamate dehydrogenase
LDHITVKKLNEDGEVLGEYQFVGLFTDRVLSEPAVNIPLLRKKFQDIIKREEIDKHTHLYRDFYSVYNSMPKHLLFMSPVEEIIQDIRSILESYGESRFKLRTRPDVYKQGLSMMVLMSKQRYNENISRKIKKELDKEFEPSAIDYRLTLGENEFVQLHFYLQTERRSPLTCSFEELEKRLYNMTRSWFDHLKENIYKTFERENAQKLVNRYSQTFPEEYQALIDPDLALTDIRNIEEHNISEKMYIDLVQPKKSDFSHLLLYSSEKIKLNQIMPLLSNHGLEIVEQSTFNLKLDPPCFLHLFRLEEPEHSPVSFEEKRNLLQRSIAGVYAGHYRDDIANQLITGEGLNPRAINLFRLYKNYFHQINPAIKLVSINRALISHSEITAALYNYFQTKFNPRLKDINRTEQLTEIRNRILGFLDDVSERHQDYILRSILNHMESTLRTNFYQEEESKHYISIKIDCSAIDEMPDPRPLYEIYIYSPFMEGIHLRGGEIARGGLRWSDRRDDFRTEVLDLMKTQMVKNSLIVPVGSKGGFVLKQDHLSDKELKKQVREQYKIFISGILDLTDNRQDGEIVRPPDVICYDKEDPYMVVAADKGTATFSDTANALSREYNYWLDDAFASGGSVGYDHKELGITARGAWVCVERHFRELGQDIHSRPFTVAGIGDMGGDVFGNGMILSNKIKLLATFNHRHIFIDPDPDPAASFAERKRLFEEELGWDGYDSDLLGAGGGVYSRSDKTVDLSDEARTLLKIEKEKPSPEDVIRQILKMDVDLLWNGGIGTYIKSSQEAHSDAGDPANDNCRVDANQVKASVIGEGGNLGITQKGRTELDNLGVRLNTDAIDNSGGVDLSDHEVNIKILLQQSIRRGELEPEERDDFLMSLSDSVVRNVTDGNYRQSGAISLEYTNSAQNMEDYRQILNHLEDSAGLDREVENLPDERQMQERIQSGSGMTRPELAVLLSYTKMDIYEQALASDWDPEWVIENHLRSYFPKEIIETCPEGVNNHPLRKEIALTSLVNYVVDYSGIKFTLRLREEIGVKTPEIIRWFLTADGLGNGQKIREKIFSFDNEIEAKKQYEAWNLSRRLLGNTVYWLFDSLSSSDRPAKIYKQFEPLLKEHQDDILDHIGPERTRRLQEKQDQWLDLGFGSEFNQLLNRLYYLVPSLDILLLCQKIETEFSTAAKKYFELGSRLHIDWLMNRISRYQPKKRWDQFGFRTLSVELNSVQRKIVSHLLENNISVEEYLDSRQTSLGRLEKIYEELQRDRRADLSGYQFMLQRLKRLRPLE